MRRTPRPLFAAVLLLAGVATSAGGCATSPARHATNVPHERFVRQHGGLVHDAREARVAGLAARLTTAALDRPLTTHVLASAVPGAFAFPDGHVYLTRGLIDLLDDDDELAAAIAHEAGHLLADAFAGPAAALEGRGRVDDIEMRADDVARILLAGAGHDPAALARALRKVAASPATAPRHRRPLLARADRLSACSTMRTSRADRD